MERATTEATEPPRNRVAEVLLQLSQFGGHLDSKLEELKRPIQASLEPAPIHTPASELLPSSVRKMIAKDIRKTDNQYKKGVRKAEWAAESQTAQKLEENANAIDLTEQVKTEADRWNSYVTRQETVEKQVRDLVGKRGKKDELWDYVTTNVPSELWEDYSVPSEVIIAAIGKGSAEKYAGRKHTLFLHPTDPLVQEYSSRVSEWTDYAREQRQKLADEAARAGTSEVVKRDQQELANNLGLEQERTAQLQEENAQLRKELQEKNQAAADERELRRKAEEKTIEASQQLNLETQERTTAQQRLETVSGELAEMSDERDTLRRQRDEALDQRDETEARNREIIADFATDQGLLHERNNRPLTAEELVRLAERGWLYEEELTPEEKRVLANAGVRDMTSRERWAVAGADVKNALTDVTGRFSRWVDTHAEITGAVGGAIGALGLRALLVANGYNVTSADILARAAVIPLGLTRMALIPTAERLQSVRQLEQRHPNATRRIKVFVNVLFTGSAAWAVESLITPGQPITDRVTTQPNPTPTKETKTGVAPPTAGPTTPAETPPAVATSLPESQELFYWPDQLTVKDTIWGTIQSEVSGKIGQYYGLSEFGQNYLTDAFKDIINTQFVDPNHVRGETINLSLDIKHQIGQHILRALEQNMANGSFTANGGTGADYEHLKMYGEVLSNLR